MTPDDNDRTAFQPAGEGFQKTDWRPGPAALPDTTLIIAADGGGPDPMGGHLPAGTRLREFEILSLIGEGGFGVVYLAQDHSLQRRVALKEYMPTSLAARVGGSQVQVKSERHRETFEAGLKSFVNEARLLASFDHPSLVRVYVFWEANGTAYMVMPYLEGTTLKDVLRRRPQPPDEVWLRSVLGPLTEALLVIHGAQCFHRDIAPDNVMLLPQSGRWLLLDFGAARRVIGDMTQALTVILKPGYAPVEQYAEIPGMKQGPWTDVYALAAVVYYAIMGRTPPPSVGRLLGDTYVPLVSSPAARDGRFSEPFLRAIDRALAVRPEQRTQSIEALRDELGLVGTGNDHFDPFATEPALGGLTAPPLAPQTLPPTRVVTRPVPPPPQVPLPLAQAVPAAPAPAAALPPPAAPADAVGPAPRRGSGIGIGMAVLVLVVVALGGAFAVYRRPAPAPVAAAVPSALAPVLPAPASEPRPGAVASPYDVSAEFRRVVAQQAPGFNLRLQTNRSQFRIGKDELSFGVTADRAGYLYVFVYGADQTLIQLYPNAHSGLIRVTPGQTLQLPQGNDLWQTTDPPGPEELLVLVSPLPRDHSALHPRQDGIVSVFPSGPEVPAGGPSLAGRALCPAAGDCDAGYGAALAKLDIVR
jgi:serine/threonine protein kinase